MATAVVCAVVQNATVVCVSLCCDKILRTVQQQSSAEEEEFLLGIPRISLI